MGLPSADLCRFQKLGKTIFLKEDFVNYYNLLKFIFKFTKVCSGNPKKLFNLRANKQQHSGFVTL